MDTIENTLSLPLTLISNGDNLANIQFCQLRTDRTRLSLWPQNIISDIYLVYMRSFPGEAICWCWIVFSSTTHGEVWPPPSFIIFSIASYTILRSSNIFTASKILFSTLNCWKTLNLRNFEMIEMSRGIIEEQFSQLTSPIVIHCTRPE